MNLTDIPSIQEFLNRKDFQSAFADVPLKIQKTVAREILQEIRESLQLMSSRNDDLKYKILQAQKKYSNFNFKRVINATGILLHTNLGRAPLPSIILENLKSLFGTYTDLEVDEEGNRGERARFVSWLLKTLFEAEDALAVNNNAGAVLLALQALARNKEVLISRGELVEIGGSFRIPDILCSSGAYLCEVGTTNRTHLCDYQNNLSDKTGLILKVHPSNFNQSGFTTSVSYEELLALGRLHHIPVLYDMGSHFLFEDQKKDFDLVCFSADKLMGGPQAGIILGKSKYVNKLRSDALYRAMRLDKFTLGVLAECLKIYMGASKNELPFYNLQNRTLDELRCMIDGVKSCVQSSKHFDLKTIETVSYCGGGSTAQGLPSLALAVLHRDFSCESLKKYFLMLDIPIYGRIESDMFLLDFKTVFEKDTGPLMQALKFLGST